MKCKKEEFLKVRQTKTGQKFLYLPKDTEFDKDDWVMIVDPCYKVGTLPTREEQK